MSVRRFLGNLLMMTTDVIVLGGGRVRKISQMGEMMRTHKILSDFDSSEPSVVVGKSKTP